VNKLVMAALIVFGGALSQWCFASEASAASEPALQFHADPADPAHGSVDLTGLDTHVIEELRRAASHIPWQVAFPVYVDSVSVLPDGSIASIAGNYDILSDRVRFTPRYPLTPGLPYRVRVNLEALFPADLNALSDPGTQAELALSFSLPKALVTPFTVVDDVFPSGDELPENLLRFYVHFSSPMQGGWSRDHIYLLGPDGRPIEAVFLNVTVELWDPSMQRLTLLLDPGRIKRGVGPNVQIGAPLSQGSRYTLVISEGMKDAVGNPLLKGFSKSFRVTEAVRRSVKPDQWTLDLPAIGTRAALVLRFPEPLDHAMLSRAIRIVDADEQPIAGSIVIDQHETQWAFTPSAAWSDGNYQLQVKVTLEDVSGNNIKAPFDSDIRSNVGLDHNADLVILPFELLPDSNTATATERCCFLTWVNEDGSAR
jgi:hypothetical protein